MSIDVAQYFFDTSALVKVYHEEAGTEGAKKIFESPDCVVRISSLGSVEIHSALAVKVRSGQLSREAAEALTLRVLADLSSGRIQPHTVTLEHFAQAERFVRRFGYDHRLRSLDALQLAVALDLKARGLVEYIVTADKLLQDVAELLGVPTVNPQMDNQ